MDKISSQIYYKLTRKYPSISAAAMSGTREHFQMKEYGKPVIYKNVSRYKNLRTVRDDVTGRLYHENINTPFVPFSDQDQYFTVTLAEKDRLDIISNMFYQTPRFWWAISIANYIIDPFDVPVGTYLRIPPIITFYKSGGLLSGK